MSKTLTTALEVIDRTQRTRLRAVDYLRVSTEEQVKGFGLSYTGKSTARYIKGKDWEHVDTFADEGKSGTLPWQERPDAKRLMDLARQEPRPIDVVVVEETRAIGREDRAFFRWYWELEELGIFVAVVDEDIDTSTEAGRARMLDKANEAFKELTKIRKRTQGGIQDKAEEGGYTGGKVRYGYRVKNQGIVGESKLVVDECNECGDPATCTKVHEAAVLRRGRELFLEFKGDRQKTVIQLNAERLFNRSGDPWNVKSFFNQLLDDDLLEGRLVWRNVNRVGTKRGVKVGPDGQPLFGRTVVIQLPRIFTDEEVRELRDMAAITKITRAPAVSSAIYTLSKRLISPCGKAYTGQGGEQKMRYYRCKGKEPAFPGAPVCDCSVVDADAIENFVWSNVSGFLGDTERLEQMAQKWLGSTAAGKIDYASRIAKLDQQIEEQNDIIVATEAAAVARQIRRGRSQDEAVQAAQRAVVPLEKTLLGLEKQRAEAEAWQKEAARIEQHVHGLRELAKQAKDRLHLLGAEKQAAFLAVLNVTVTVKANPQPGRAGSPCSLLKWFTDNARVVPHLTDEAWEKVKDIAEDRAYRKLTARQILAGLLYKARTGCRWPELPEEFGAHESVKTYWKRWDKAGTWEQIMERLADEPGVPVFQGPSKVPPMAIRGELIPEIILDSERLMANPYRSA
ncbi:recombinase family protein [Streptomyces griseosporeus]|uniref:recombinase family protein n=1 Tax=Streptomyces griseosporeus TaxID=1910 RepID=UPI0036C17AE7